MAFDRDLTTKHCCLQQHSVVLNFKVSWIKVVLLRKLLWFACSTMVCKPFIVLRALHLAGKPSNEMVLLPLHVIHIEPSSTLLVMCAQVCPPTSEHSARAIFRPGWHLSRFGPEFRARNSKERPLRSCDRHRIYNTRSPVDGERLISIDADLLLLMLFRLLLLLPSMRMVSDGSGFVFVSGRWTCGIPFKRPCCGAASGTMRRKKPLAQPHGNILPHRRIVDEKQIYSNSRPFECA